MGYYSQLYYEIEEGTKVNKEEIKKITEYFDSEKEDICGFMGVDFSLKENILCSIDLEDYYQKFYDGKIFSTMLSKALLSGRVKLYFHGEDGGSWSIEIMPNKIRNLYMAWVPEEKYEKVLEVIRDE